MTEAEWEAASGPEPLLDFVDRRLSDRRRRLFACACCRQVWPLLPDANSRRAVETAERFADGLATERERATARAASLRAARSGGSVSGQAAWAPYWAASNFIRPAVGSACVAASEALARQAGLTRQGLAAVSACDAARDAAAADQARRLRDLVGNPFRPARLDPAWLTWNDGLVPRLARSLYEEGDYERLPILADALEDAGCTDAAILGHCRGPGPHVRGCWVVDLILGQQ